MFPRRTRAWFKLINQKILNQLGLHIRIIFCFAVGLTVLFATRQGSYDTRFYLRGAQSVNQEIVIVQIKPDDLNWVGVGLPGSINLMWSLKEIVEASDSYFWHPVLWEKALSKLLKFGVRSAAVTLFFGEEVVRGTMSDSQRRLFLNPNIFWAAKADSRGTVIFPGLANSGATNVGTIDLKSDHDGKVRHFHNIGYSTPHLGLRVANYLRHEKQALQMDMGTFEGKSINFQGPHGTFKVVPFSNLLNGKARSRDFENKIVIIAAPDFSTHRVQTPIGAMSQGEVLANILYSFQNDRWISEVPLWIAAAYLLIILIIALWIIFEYPQPVAFVLLTFQGILIMTLSAALFDLSAIWLPAIAPVSIMLVAYFVIFSYRLNQSEKLNWQSERELHYLTQVESLKNNFLSLISHDLKNPLAKIQGITDRLLANPEAVPQPVKEDLASIKSTSEELRQYITSILQVTRVEARDIKLTREVCDLNSIVLEVLDRLKPLAEQKNIVIQHDLEPLFSMELDRTLISEVLINLVENAIKYSDQNSLIKIVSQEMGHEVKVEVIDSGGGIKEEEIPKIFDKFYRGSGDKTIKSTGTGLGLYLVKYFIELHGGKVFITSKPGEGTRIGFTLPILEESEDTYAEFAPAHR